MKLGPDIALVAALLGDPARANMLTSLMGGRALSAGELARDAGVSPPTASAHLSRLETGGLIVGRRQGRHVYYALSGPDVAEVVEALMGLAARTGHSRLRTGPKEPALRQARVCYDHLAGDLGVALLDALRAQGALAGDDETLALTPAGRDLMRDFGVDPASLEQGRRPACRTCLDWSVRRAHLAGGVGAAILARVFALGWAHRLDGERIVRFTPEGLRAFQARFDVAFQSA